LVDADAFEVSDKRQKKSQQKRTPREYVDMSLDDEERVEQLE